ncbi:A/G-specific adenine glycosylase [soil metagenome]
MHMISQQFSHSLLTWYDQHGRHQLPWREHISAYKVWVSEIMLQQTQVVTVIPYFLRFMQRFPTVEVLAAASVDEVLALWAGLGYYARGRNLHRSAQLVCQHYQGAFPQDILSLQSLPGIGRSTAGAILAISANQPTAILDGNVKRVLSRFAAVSGWSGNRAVAEKLWQLAEYYTPQQRAGDYTQALMDLGATVCTRAQPQCEVCPLALHCIAHQQNAERDYPQPKPRKQLPSKSVYLLLVKNAQGKLLLEKRPPVGIWGGLWSLPECAIDVNVVEWARKQYGCQLQVIEMLPSFRHTFRHYYLHITPILSRVERYLPKLMESSRLTWYDLEQITDLGLPAPVSKLIQRSVGY